ncbi:MAG: hypothetical protein JSS38_18605 [Nitrospira sp.]|nr:hypothetical protein [Nitrospira sp.]
MQITIPLIVLLVISNNALAEQCESVIDLAKLSSISIADKSEVDQHASNFCSEYSKSGGKSSSSSFGASYKFLSLSSGNADTSVEAIASKYCSASSSFSQSSNAYKQYVEAIAPGAFEAYQQCIHLAGRDVYFNLSPASTLADEFSMTVAFRGSGEANKSATLSATSASGISCSWGDSKTPNTIIGSGKTTVLRCTRTATNKRGYVVVARTDGTKETMTIPWKAYKDGVPVDGLRTLEEQLRATQMRISELESRLGSLATQVTTPDARYVKSDDLSYVKRGDKIRLHGRPNTNECIYNHGGNGVGVVTGDCGNNDATLYGVSKP